MAGDSDVAKPVTADVVIVVRLVSSWSLPLPHSGLQPLMTEFKPEREVYILAGMRINPLQRLQ